MNREPSHLERQIGGKSLEALPPIEIRFFLGRHARAEDVDAIKENLEWCDVFVEEYYGTTKGRVADIQAISDGERENPDFFLIFDGEPLLTHANNPFYTAALLEKLYASKKIVANIDIPLTTKAYKETRVAMDGLLEFRETLMEQRPSLAHAIIEYREAVTRFAQANRARDEYMTKSLPQVLKNIVKKSPELKQLGRPLRILVQLGAGHVPVYAETKSKHPDTTLTFQEHPIIFSVDEEIMRRAVHDKELSDVDCARGIVAMLIAGYVRSIYKIHTPNAHQEFLLRTFVTSLTAFDIRDLYDFITDLPENERAAEQVRDHLVYLMQMKRLPSNDADAKKWIENEAIQWGPRRKTLTEDVYRDTAAK